MIPRRPACGCCDCIAADHDFNIDGEDLGPKFLAGSGDFYRTGGVATIDSPSDGDFAYRQSPQLFTTLGVPISHAGTCRVRSSEDGDQIGLIFRYTATGMGAGDKSVVLLEVGSAAKISIWTNTGTPSPAFIKVAEGDVIAPADTWHELEVCTFTEEGVEGGGAMVYLNGEPVASTMQFPEVSGVTDHFLAGTLTGNLPVIGPYTGTVTGTPEWDDLKLWKGRSETLVDCPACPTCDDCGFTDDFSDGLDGVWRELGGSALTSAYGASGRARVDGVGAQIGRCVNEPELDDAVLSWSATIYWEDAGGEVANPGIFVDIPADKRLLLTVHRDGSTPIYRVTVSGIGSTDLDSPAPAQGDRLTIGIFSEGGGSYLVQFSVNGAAIHEQSLTLDFSADHRLVVGLQGTADGDAYCEWDDAALDCSPVYYYYYADEPKCCEERPSELYVTLFLNGSPVYEDEPIPLIAEDPVSYDYFTSNLGGMGSAEIVCVENNSGTPYFSHPGAGIEGAPLLTIESCDPFLATWTGVDGGDTYEVTITE